MSLISAGSISLDSTFNETSVFEIRFKIKRSKILPQVDADPNEGSKTNTDQNPNIFAVTHKVEFLHFALLYANCK